MGYLVSIEDVTPPARADGRPWTGAILSESATIGGPWKELETFAISPLDTDPEKPGVRMFSTDKAELAQGWYQLVLTDAESGKYAMNPVSIFPKVFAPTVADVAMFVTARTIEAGSGERVGTFTPDTRPTAFEVQQLIVKATGTVSAIAVVTVSSEPQLILQARNLASLFAAMLVELSYFPEQVNSGQSSYEDLRGLYEKGVASLVDALPDSNESKKGLYSIRTRSEVAGVFPTDVLLP